MLTSHLRCRGNATSGAKTAILATDHFLATVNAGLRDVGSPQAASEGTEKCSESSPLRDDLGAILIENLQSQLSIIPSSSEYVAGASHPGCMIHRKMDTRKT